ncbi:MAG: hypothetical protein BroJett031_09390 [Betaproteobacteria bacterium]|nr:MAG: hypothetical protein BroJett031_09390 [Betaproteobacteria bacterium]
MRAAAAVFGALLAGCVSVQLGTEGARHVNLVLADARPAMARRDAPAARALLIQAVPADPLANTRSIAYARSPGAREFYQLASWTEPPLRAITRLLQQRLEARGTAEAVGLLGQPIAGDWLLAIGVEAVYHDVAAEPGTARLVLRAELIDRRARTLAARRTFEAAVPVERADSAAAAAALGRAVADTFDALVPWVEEQLARAASAPRAAVR